MVVFERMHPPEEQIVILIVQRLVGVRLPGEFPIDEDLQRFV